MPYKTGPKYGACLLTLINVLVLHSIKSHLFQKANYLLNGAHFEVVQETKNLGVIIQSDLRFNTHTEQNVQGW